MANQDHLDILKQGAKAWNQWQREHSDIVVDLSGANLRKAYLRRANLEGADLSGADLSGADLSKKAWLVGANLIRALQLHFLSTALMVLKKEKKT